MLTALVFLAILTSAVMIHEFAHFFNAKSVGLEVRAFSVGMGPVVWRKLWRGTEWRVSLLPLGGYVDIPGMAPKQDELGTLQHPDEGFATRTLPQKLWVLVGGVLANFALAILLMSVVLTNDPLTRVGVLGLDVPTQTEIGGVVEGSAAQRLGLQAGDRVLAVNSVQNPDVQQLIDTIHSADGLELTLLRNGETVTVTTDWPPYGVEVPQLGVSIGAVPTELPPNPSLLQAVGESTTFLVRAVPQAITGFVRGFAAVFMGRQTEEVAGPVQLVTYTSQAARAGFVKVLFLAALINFSLAIFNLLPIPGLDGGRMLLAVIVSLRGKPFKPGQEEFIHFLGFMAILAFMVLITFNEVSGLFTRG